MPPFANTVAANAAAVVLFGGALMVMVAALGARWPRGARAAATTALLIYGALVGWITLGLGYADPDGPRAINLTPFQEIMRAVEGDTVSPWLNFLGNILLFAPLGAFMALLIRGRWGRRILFATMWGALLSTGIELTQLTLGRVADVDDIMLNATGALLGAMLAPAIAGASRTSAHRYDGPGASSSVGRAADF